MHEDQEEHTHDEPVKEPSKQDERGYTELTPGEKQVSLSIHKASTTPWPRPTRSWKAATSRSRSPISKPR